MDVIHGRISDSHLKSEGAGGGGVNSIDKTKSTDPPYAQDPRWLLVERILATPDFERSPRLAEFLRHVCRLTLEGRSKEISEQSLGEVVFGRSPGFDSSADTIVRSHALRLRHRLEFYFSSEGAHEPLWVEIPRGGYVPRFYTPQSETPPVAEFHIKAGEAVDVPESKVATPQSSAQAPQKVKWFQQTWIKSFVAGCAVGAIAIAVAYHFAHGAPLAAGHPEIKQTDISRQFWSSLFPAGGRTLIVPGDSGLVLFETVTGQEVNLSDYLNGAYPELHQAKTSSFTVSKAVASDLASRRYTSMVDLDLASKLTHLPEWGPEHAEIVFARDLRPADASRSNLILIGSREANPWISLLEPSMNFILSRDDKGVFYFVNRHPGDGEREKYHPKQETGNLGADDVYGDVAYLPNPGGTGMVLALNGIWMSGTESAGNFVLDDAQLSKWLKSIVNVDGTIPPFELLIGTRNLQGNATYSSIIAKRVGSH